MKTNPLRFDRRKKGQSLVEFALLTTFVVLLLAAASFEVANYSSLALRIGSSTREAGRLFVAEEIAPTSGTVSENQTRLYTEIRDKVYLPTVSMIAPADMTNKGKMIVSIIKRNDPNSDTTYNASNPDTGYSEYDPTTETDDNIKVEYQFSYPVGAPSGWTSAFGAQNATVSSIPLSALRVDERAVVIEIYHRIDSIFPDGALKTAKLDVLYDKAIF